MDDYQCGGGDEICSAVGSGRISVVLVGDEQRGTVPHIFMHFYNYLCNEKLA